MKLKRIKINTITNIANKLIFFYNVDTFSVMGNFGLVIGFGLKINFWNEIDMRKCTCD